jgi:hypothetical protein
VTHAIGGDPSVAPGQTVDDRTIEVINHACQQLYARPWRWRESTIKLDLTADQEHLTLPDASRFSEGGEFVSMTRMVDGRTVELITPEEMDRLRDSNSGTPVEGYTACVALPWQSGVQWVHVYPTPVSTTVNAIRMRYRQQYLPMNTDTADSKTFSFPEYVDPLFTAYLRAYAQGYEDDGLPARIAEIDAGPMLQTALMKDGIASRDVGRLRPQRGRTFRRR